MKFKSLSVYLQTAIITFAVSVLAFLICIFCFFNGNKDIPLGIALGGTLASLVYVLEYVADKKDHERLSVKWAIILLIARFLVFAGILVMVIIFQFKLQLGIFNVWSYVASYLSSVVVLCILMLMEKEKKNGRDS